MIKFSAALTEWKTPMFSDAFQTEIEKLDVDQLLLQQALQNGSHASREAMKIIILSSTEDDASIYVNIGVFYSSLIPGCQCDDDPSPMNVENEYCELAFVINKLTAETKIALIS